MYHNILNVMLHQVLLGGDQHRSAKGVQVRVMQLVWQAVNFVRCVHVDVSEGTRERCSACSAAEICGHQTSLWVSLKGLTWLPLAG